MLCPKLVGRADESRLLWDSLDALEDGRGACVFVAGEPGVGKTRLLEELIAEAGRRGVWLMCGRASQTCQAVPYQSLSGALLYGFRSRPLESLSEEIGGVRAGLAAMLPGFVEGPAVPPTPMLLGETVLRLAGALGGDVGTLIVLEDLHWSCADSLAVIEYLADSVATERVLLVGTTRIEGAAPPVIDALERRGAAAVRVLAPLSPAEVDEMAASCLEVDEQEVPGAVLDLLESQADGLPFVVEELLASVVSSRGLIASPGGWELTGSLESLGVPLSFAEAVRERLAQLSPAARKVIDTAAILGRDFDWSHLPGLTGSSEAEVLEALSEAIDLLLVEETGGDRFRFRHALTVDAILAQLLEPQRVRMACAALDELVLDPEWSGSELLELAAHLAIQAGRSAEAGQYLTEDARRALSAGALDTAIATARRARKILPDRHPETVAAGEVLLAALSQAGDTLGVEEVGHWLLPALEADARAGERGARVRLLLAKAAHIGLDLPRARALCEEARALDPPDRRLRVQLDLMLAEIAFSEHRHDEAVADAQAVLGQADANGFDDLACEALELLGRHAMFVALQLRQAEPYLLDALRRAEVAGLPLARLRVLQSLAFHDLARGAGSARMEDGRALALELGAFAMGAEFEQLLTTHHLVANELDSAAEYAERAFDEARRYGLVELTVLMMGLRATIAAVRGQRQDAERGAADALALAEGLPALVRAGVSGTPLTAAALADDDLAVAAQRVSETRALLPDDIVFLPPFVGSFYGIAAVVKAVAGDGALVKGRDWVEVDDVFQRCSYLIARAIVAGREGDRDRAAALFAEGDDGLVSVPWVRALYRRYAGEAALAHGWGDPARWLGEAEAYLERCGNEPLARACRSLLRLAGTSPRRRRAAQTEERYAGLELTTREADVLALLAEGLTNKEIAGRLYLSPRTVEKHVERILTKTGQPNRTALAAFATERSRIVPAAQSLT
jgi:DNA-binding CsgD family transcriptional regulator